MLTLILEKNTAEWLSRQSIHVESSRVRALVLLSFRFLNETRPRRRRSFLPLSLLFHVIAFLPILSYGGPATYPSHTNLEKKWKNGLTSLLTQYALRLFQLRSGTQTQKKEESYSIRGSFLFLLSVTYEVE